ncbi:sensor histidine kinase [Streptomyces sp. NPDC059517]|uniref:sensor histidine kinase n=1 Tax=Streptomyces sp. NPDC059517 TaxID=3346855 RepID=UPI003673FD55
MNRPVPLRKRLLVRLLLTSVLIAICSVAATAWLAVETTTRAIQEEQGQVLAEDMDILRQLSGYAATHRDWSDVARTVRELSDRTGRRIALTTPSRTPIADSETRHTALPPRAAAAVDPLHTDTFTDPGAQVTGIDPRAVGPYRLTPAEREHVALLAEKRRACFAGSGVETSVTRLPSGRSVLTDADGSVDGGQVPARCADGVLNTPTETERKALAELTAYAEDCLGRAGVEFDAPLGITVDFTDHSMLTRYVAKMSLAARLTTDRARSAEQTRKAAVAEQAERCVVSSRRRQLTPYVAPAAELFLGHADSAAPHFDMSAANKAKVTGVAGLVLALTVAATALVAGRLVRPLRALTHAAQQPPEQHVRVPVTTQDETGILAVAFNDLTERRERMEAQRKAMVADIAHELRTPLTNIRGWLEVARDGIVDPDPELLASLHEEALVLQRVIDDLQDLAAAEAGTLALHREPVRADELLEQVVAAHRVAAEAAGIGLCTAVDGTPWLDADPLRMRQALGNLVSNAIRHTPADGTITLSAGRHGDELHFQVADTGGGIASEDLTSVFERFWRAEKSRSRRTGGSGLGLPIVRQLVTAHGGTVTVTSEVGKGSVFTLRLPGAR